MAVITWPVNLRPGPGTGWGQRRYDLSFSSDATGAQQDRVLGPPRWQLSIVQPEALPADLAGQWQAVIASLRGRVNHLAAWNFGRPQPLGTLRGTPTLASTAAAGATSATLAGCTNANILLRGSFEVDTDGNGLADDVGSYTAGSTGTVTNSRTAGPLLGGDGVWVQKVAASALNGDAGILRGRVPITAGAVYSASADHRTTAGATTQISIVWQDSGFAQLSQADATTTQLEGRLSVTGTAPAGAAYAVPYVFMRATSGAAHELLVDQLQLELGAPTPYAGFPTLKRGDMLQLGTGLGTSQLVMVTADATATDAGVMAITFEPPIRTAINSGTAVTWFRPLAYFKASTPNASWAYGAAAQPYTTGMSLDLLEHWA